MNELAQLRTPEDLDRWLAASRQRPVWLFKHSLTCPVSFEALREYRRFAEAHPCGEGGRFGLLEIQRARPVSDAVADRTGVRHESPQAILLSGGAAIWHESHWGIRADALAAAERAASAAGVSES